MPTLYQEPKDTPIQGIIKSDGQGWIELEEQYQPGLKGLDGCNHVRLIDYFHRSTEKQLRGKPFLEDETHSIFAIRSAHRPNHLQLSIMKLQRIDDNKILFTEVDRLDGPPRLDLKPYSRYFDCRE